MSKKVLGKGLEALIPPSLKQAVERVDAGPTHAATTGDEIHHIPIADISANPRQPRKQFDPDKIRTLSESIRNDGVLQPVVVRYSGGRYQLIMGERRLQAARLAGVPTVPAVVRQVADVDALRLALVENLQRENLNPIEIAEAYRTLVDRFGLSQSELADLVGKDRSTVANTLRLLGLPEEIRNMIVDGRITEGHARALLALPTRAEQFALAGRIVKDAMSVRQVEALTTPRRQPQAREAREARSKPEKPAHIKHLENAMSQHLATRVSVEEKRGGRGRIVIEFYSHDDFDRLTELMQVPIPR